MTGGIGFSNAARNSLEKNLSLLDKFNASHFKKAHYKITKKRLYQYREASPAQIAEIKNQIRKEERKTRQASLILLVILMVAIFSIATFILT